MKNQATTQLFSILFLLLIAIAPKLSAKTENPGPFQTTRVDRIRVDHVGPSAVIKVSASKDKYDTLNSKSLSVGYSAEVVCKSLWDVFYFDVALGKGGSWLDIRSMNISNKPIGIYTDTLQKWDKDSGKRSFLVNNRKLTGPIHPKLEQQAYKQCNAKAKQVSQQQNISLRKAMSVKRVLTLQSNWIKSNLRLNAWASCSKPQVYNTWFSVFETAPAIKVECNAIPKTNGSQHSNVPSKRARGIIIDSVFLKASQKKHFGQCPKKIVLTGKIKAINKGTISYQWKSGNTISTKKKLTFEKSSTRTVSRSLNINQSQKKTYSLIVNGKMSSNPVTVTVQCSESGGKIVAPRPDLVPGDSLTIASSTAKWGGQLYIDASKLQTGKRGNLCKMRFQYKVKNIGKSDAGSFSSKLFSTKTLHKKNLISLNKKSSKKISGHLYLDDGEYIIAVTVDDKKAVLEKNEGNNTSRIKVLVNGCNKMLPR